MAIVLTRAQIGAALPLVATGLAQYQWLQARAASVSAFETDAVFRKRFNHFYRVRRAVAWQDAFYTEMSAAKRSGYSFLNVLQHLHTATGRFEASFASKLYATLHPSAPVIDSVVLGNLGLRLPAANHPSRAAAIVAVHASLSALFASYLATTDGRYLVQAFDSMYPAAGITDEKKLDLVLWQSR
jgi:hypothetical protein